MQNLAKVLLGLAILGFVLAAVGVLTGVHVLSVSPEGYSYACTNLALLGIGFSIIFKDG